MKYIVLFLLLASFTAAETVVLYSGDTINFTGNPISATLSLKSNANLDAAVAAYNAVRDGTDTTAKTSALTFTKEELLNAKVDDLLIVKTPWENLLLNYKECKSTGGYTFCFDAITYYEEDVNPLGDSRLDTVKVVDGSFKLPVTLRIDALSSKLEATRTINDTTLYLGDTAEVTVRVTNKGTEMATGVKISETVPFRVKRGETTLAKPSLESDGVVELVYVIEADKAGSFNFTGAVDSKQGSAVLPSTPVTVKEPLLVEAEIQEMNFAGDTIPFKVTLKNNFGADIVVTDFTVKSKHAFAKDLAGPAKRILGTGEQSLDTFTVKKTNSTTITGELDADSSGSFEFVVTLQYTASQEHKKTLELPYTIRARTVYSDVSFSASAATVTVENTAIQAAQNVRVSFGDGTTEELGAIPLSGTKKVVHEYSFSEKTPVTVVVYYELDGKQQKKSFPGTVLAKSTTPAPSVQQPETVPETPATQPDEQPAQAPVIEEKKGIISRFIGFLSSLFS
jgi:uncharacterized repeat protein (TIGR01451 family)